MTRLGRLLWAALLFCPAVAGAQYVADTGRSEKPTLAASPVAVAPQVGAPAGPAVEKRDEAFESALMAAGLGKVAVQGDGINQTLLTFADVKIHEITGKGGFNRQLPMATVLSMIYQQSRWLEIPLIPVEGKGLTTAFGLDPAKRHRVSPLWIMQTPQVRQVVLAGVTGGEEADKKLGLDEATVKSLNKLRYRLFAFYNLPTDFKIVPIEGAGSAWASPAMLRDPSSVQDEAVSRRLGEISKDEEPYASALAFDAALAAAVVERKTDGLGAAAARLIQQSGAQRGAMPNHIRLIDYWNTRLHPFGKAATLFSIAFFAFLWFAWTSRRDLRREDSDGNAGGETVPEAEPAPIAAPQLAYAGAAGVLDGPRVLRASLGATESVALQLDRPKTGSRVLWGIAFSAFAAATVVMLVALGMRFVVGGRMPVSNLYESLVFAMGAFAVVGLVYEGMYRQGWAGWTLGLAGWIVMALANSMPLQMRRVEPLVAVLDSPWLNFHVTSLLISYSLFFAAFVFGVMFFVREWAGARTGGWLPASEVLEYLIYRSIQVGWPLLTLGIVLGAVWANTAWGNAWSWDPKETWALITWLTYTVYLHFRIILGWQGRRAVVASMVGFGMVLITYFGVNYLPGLSGGMHSYAQPISR